MRLFEGVTLLLLTCATFCRALFEEEAGKLDFLIATAGHGPVRFVQVVGNSIITSDSPPQPPLKDARSTSCYVASRELVTGELLWRRNVCSTTSPAEEQRHAVVIAGHGVITMDLSGAVRAWSLDSGALLWDALTEPTDKLSLWTWSKDSKEYVAAAGSHSLKVFDATTGQQVENHTIREVQSARPGTPTGDSLEVFCSEAKLFVAAEEGSLVAWHSEQNSGKRDNNDVVKSDLELSEKDKVTGVTLVSCSKASVAVLLTSHHGVTAQISFAIDGAASVKPKTMWTAEEGLAQVSSALILDSSHHVDEIEEGKEISLQFFPRLTLQWKAVKEIFSSESASERRDHIFGFVKIIVLLSTNKLFGIGTTGKARSNILYHVNLPENAEWHRMIHGSVNAAKSSHGGHGAAHSRELLVISSCQTNGQREINWLCVDGTNGAVHTRDTLSISSPVVQIIPVAGGGSCRQGAMIMLHDRSILTIPSEDLFKELPGNSIFTHTIDKEDASVESYRISYSNGRIRSHLVGSTAFSGERVLSVAYPSREEVVQSSSSVLGDDSLLLKFLNPHLTVLVTMSSNESGDDRFSSAFIASQKGAQKRKPAGAGDMPGGTDSLSGEEANLFINVVDSVSGRLIYRASHANAIASPTPSVLVSENWVFYTFLNKKSRRAELGVLSLYEGMIGSKGLTAFTSPEQSIFFSSLDARETKPVVLAKTYSLATPTAALGMTSTRGGISSRRLLLAGMDGQILAVDRKMLEPRRPLGEVKDTEKKEGLRQYAELIPTVSYMSLTYNQTVESPTTIITAPADLESQTIVLAFGGPDIFFTRTSPSRSFDLLPDSFNRILLSIVVAGLLVVLVVVQQLVSKKVRKQGWV